MSNWRSYDLYSDYINKELELLKVKMDRQVLKNIKTSGRSHVLNLILNI